MKIVKLLIVLSLIAAPAFAAKIKTGEDLISAMHKKYEGRWYKTLTFVQKTVTFKEDGTSNEETWYEALSLPGGLRIDIAPKEKGNGMIFANDTLYSFRDGKLAAKRPLMHPLLILGFDVYLQPVEKTISQLKKIKMDLSVLREDTWEGRKVYVVGAKAGDLKTPQFWIDKKNLLFVRLIEAGGKDGSRIADTRFEKYEKVKGGGWIAPRVTFYVNGKLFMTEDYADIQAGVSLDPALFDPEKWMQVERSYYLKRS
jgi:hypothetical protein